MSNTRIQVDNNRCVRIVRNENVRNAGTTIVACERYNKKMNKLSKYVEMR